MTVTDIPRSDTIQTWTEQSFEQFFKLCFSSYWGTLFPHEQTRKKLNWMSEIRFSSMIFLFRMAGIPLKMKKVSTIYSVYMVTVITCSFSTYIGMFLDVYMHRDDLGRAMTTLRVLIPITNIMWIFSYCK